MGEYRMYNSGASPNVLDEIFLVGVTLDKRRGLARRTSILYIFTYSIGVYIFPNSVSTVFIPIAFVSRTEKRNPFSSLSYPTKEEKAVQDVIFMKDTHLLRNPFLFLVFVFLLRFSFASARTFSTANHFSLSTPLTLQSLRSYFYPTHRHTSSRIIAGRIHGSVRKKCIWHADMKSEEALAPVKAHERKSASHSRRYHTMWRRWHEKRSFFIDGVYVNGEDAAKA